MTQSLEDKINWLMDRARISDLLFSFARAIDSKDADAYVANFADNGVVEIPDPNSATGEMIVISRDRMRETLTKGVFGFTATHHLSANHQIEIDGDTATSRSYLQAVHVGESPFDHWDAGGWYDCSYRRVDGQWKFVHVRLTAVWLRGEPGGIRPE